MVEVRRATIIYPKYLLFGISAVILKLGIYFLQLQNMTESPNTVIIKNGNSSATVHLFGATLTSWISQGKEVLFVSKKSLFDNKKAIRGGVPVVFPQFGPWANGPQHGFARIFRWSLKDEHKTDAMSVTLVLEDTEATRSYWDFKFRFEYTLSLLSETQLKMDAVITNTGDSSFSFTFLLHTYFSVPDVTLCRVTGLKDCTYIDKIRNGKEFIDDREEVTVSEFTDRIYKNTSAVHKIKNLSGDREGSVEKFNLPDTVIWNPWIENAKSMTDFGDDEWKTMICVEAGYVSSPVTLQSSKSFVASQILSVH